MPDLLVIDDTPITTNEQNAHNTHKPGRKPQTKENRKDHKMKKLVLAAAATLITVSAYANPVAIQDKTQLVDFNSSRTADSR